MHVDAFSYVIKKLKDFTFFLFLQDGNVRYLTVVAYDLGKPSLESKTTIKLEPRFVLQLSLQILPLHNYVI